MRVLVTGASGFIGRALVRTQMSDLAWRGAYRAAVADSVENNFLIGDIGPDTDWGGALEGVDAVVHLAALAHGAAKGEALKRVNVQGVQKLVEDAARAGVSRLVYVSSIKAVGERTEGEAFSEVTPARPSTPYGRAKLAAEASVLGRASINPIVLRPPLVVAPDAKANFAALLALAGSGLPLPFRDTRNARSLITRESLVAAIVNALRSRASGLFHLAGKNAPSTADMLTWLREGMGQKANLFRAPALAAVAPRVLRESLVVDDRKFRSAIGYGNDERDMAQALRSIGQAWKATQ